MAGDWLYESDVEGDWIVDCAVRSNHKVTCGPIIGCHVAPHIFPMSVSSKNCYGLRGFQTLELCGRQRFCESWRADRARVVLVMPYGIFSF
jgi:hypothetical protein